MIKFIIFIIIILMIIGGGNVFEFSSAGDFWTIKINHQELLSSLQNGVNIVYGWVDGLINNAQNSTADK